MGVNCDGGREKQPSAKLSYHMLFYKVYQLGLDPIDECLKNFLHLKDHLLDQSAHLC